MGALLIPLLILAVVVGVAFVAWELYFVKSGERAIVEQHRAEGDDEPPRTL